MKTLSILLVLAIATLAMAKPSGNMAKTTRYYGSSGYIGSARVYESQSSKRSYYYNSKGIYQGQSVEKK